RVESTIAPDEAVAEPPPAAPIVSETAQVVETAEAEGRPNVNSWMAGAVSPWEAELERASQLTSTWDSVKIVEPEVVAAEKSSTEEFLNSGLMSSTEQAIVEAPVEEKTLVEVSSFSAPAPFLEAATEPLPESSVPQFLHASVAEEELPAIESLLSPETKEILQEETAQAVAEQQPELAHESSIYAPSVAAESAPAAANIDETVAKVLAKMNPDVLQAVTREILKPLVEAMIKDELHKK